MYLLYDNIHILWQLIGGTPMEEMPPPPQQQQVEESKPEERKEEVEEKKPILHRQEKARDTIEVMGKRVEMMTGEKVMPEVPKAEPVEQPKAPVEVSTWSIQDVLSH